MIEINRFCGALKAWFCDWWLSTCFLGCFEQSLLLWFGWRCWWSLFGLEVTRHEIVLIHHACDLEIFDCKPNIPTYSSPLHLLGSLLVTCLGRPRLWFQFSCSEYRLLLRLLHWCHWWFHARLGEHWFFLSVFLQYFWHEVLLCKSNVGRLHTFLINETEMGGGHFIYLESLELSSFQVLNMLCRKLICV